MNPLLLCDFYKIGHRVQYPTDTEFVWTNWTPRTSRVPGQETVVHFGLQYFIKEYLQGRFNNDFFRCSVAKVIAEYRAVMKATLGLDNVNCDHIEALHELGHLPVTIYSIPEGYSVPLNCPSMVVVNTDPRFFWLPNYLETMLSMVLWKPSTSATTAQRFRALFAKWAKAHGETDLGFVDWQGHDFSMRGMSGMEDAVLSGMGHLLSFSGTDSIPAILTAQKFYGADLSCGGSVPATEHSVMCAGTKEGEFETFRHIIEDVYPTGIVSIVSDTWDLWKVLTDYVPRLKDKILARQGKIVIRPDSGDPVKIICGDPDASEPNPRKGTLRLLAEALGVNDHGLINNAGAIYGDSINEERADAILGRTVNELGLSPYNMVFGIGSFTYEYRTRDTYGFAMKATAVQRSGKVIDIFKDPVTDDGGKRSHKGIPAVYQTEESTEKHPTFMCVQGSRPEYLDHCSFQKVFSNGELLIDDDFETIRKRVRA